MQAAQIIEQIQAAGGQLALINGGLRGKNLTDSTRQLVKQHKADIIHLLLEPPVELNLKPCPICGGLNFIHGHKGGYYCVSCQPNALPSVPVRAGSSTKIEITEDQ